MSTAKSKQPASFAWLLRDTLVTVGVTYVSPEHLRKSKTSDSTNNANHSSLTTLLWRALHDLSMVLLADFDIDPATLAIESQRLSEEPSGIEVCIDVSRYYLYDWGFLCREFYVSPSPLGLPGAVLLSALAFVLTYGDFFSRQALAILRLQLSDNTACLAPFPHEPPLQRDDYMNAIDDAIETHRPSIVHQVESQPTIPGVVHRIHAAYGALQYKLREFHALKASHAKYVDRIRAIQVEQLGGDMLVDDEAMADRVLTPYALWLLRHPAQLTLHVQALEKRLANFADEARFYQWMGSVAGQVRPLPRLCML
ncbi:hypothetical protein, variant [Aphanomyces invadans]|uniref:Uncharacterized protein n=1 Tax=Aphanomyces invadans TaxID=157072 RepID=A0A024U642_9STRA|nr:hypothetical protein, variant [Aphanomyces invadans]ETW01078.1 hypothetical protein, variant [Aphanomyces invadans]|eukprot:XP_008870076.1 hypothetical protein, variant [Aphanomyces invadans]